MQYPIFIMRTNELEIPAGRVMEPEEIAVAIHRPLRVRMCASVKGVQYWDAFVSAAKERLRALAGG